MTRKSKTDRVDAVVVEALETEHSRFAMELHDGIGQDLTGSMIFAEQLADHLRDADPYGFSLAQQVLSLQRSIASGLRQSVAHHQPAGFVSNGLDFALTALADRINALKGFTARFHGSDVDVSNFNASAALQLYRIAQEAANNAIKHSRGNEITISLTTVLDDQLRLSIADNGTGFAPVSKPGHSGVANMYRRARMLDADLSFASNADAESGAVVSCTVPLSRVLDAADMSGNT